jgi:uncharacterized protein YnzC (UPF0291/DUF896 family)
MEQAKIERINALSRKSKTEGLTDVEKIEQKALREEYVACFRRNLEAQLENTYIVDEFGNRERLSKRVK